MKYHYVQAERWFRWRGGDPRGYRPRQGWEAWPVVIDTHPITGRPLKDSQWWVQERFVGA